MKTHAAYLPELDDDSIHTPDDLELISQHWQERILQNLTDVATLLDCLEAWQVSERKLFTLDDGTFLVQWRD